ISILSPSSRCAADERDRRTRAIREREDTSHGAVCLIICRFGIAPYRILDPRFFILFMSVMHLGMEPAQFHDFIQGTGDRHGATLFARILSAVNFKSIGHKNHDPFSPPSTAEVRFIARTAAQPKQVIKQKEKD